MFSVQELKGKYTTFTEDELFELSRTIKEYTPEASQALDAVLEEREGKKSFLDRMNLQRQIEKEFRKITLSAKSLLKKNHSVGYIQGKLKSDMLNESEVKAIIVQAQKEYIIEQKNLSMNGAELAKGLLGGLIGGTVGGGFLALPLIWGEMIMGVMALGVVWVSFQFVSKFTGKSKENKSVIILTILASVYAVWLGFYLYGFFGYQGNERI